MTSDQVLEVLLDTAQRLELVGDKWRSSSYHNAIDSLRNRDLTTLSEHDLLQLPGVGKSIAKSVQEIFATGTCHRLVALQHSGVPSVSTLLKVKGIGPATARDLWRDHGITTIGQLLKALENGSLQDPVLIKRVKKALTTSERIPREAMEEALKGPLSKLKKLPFVIKLAVAGSIRRKAPTVKDADILICIKKTKTNLAKLFEACQRIFGSVAGGETKLRTTITIGGNPYDVDLMVIEDESWGAALNYFTGSAQHNIAMREMAKERGLRVNEYGVWKGNKNLGGRHEEDLFSILGVPFLEPEQRTGLRFS